MATWEQKDRRSRRISVITAIAGAALTLGVQAVPAQEGPASLAVSPEVARQVEMGSFEARPATLAVSPEVARQVELGGVRRAAGVARGLAGGRPRGRPSARGEAREPGGRAVVDAIWPRPHLGDELGSENRGGRKSGSAFGIGILLAVGLFLSLRMGRTRHLAH